jgi:two-component system, NarL family, nitrate/nitrite response regulator NarL
VVRRSWHGRERRAEPVLEPEAVAPALEKAGGGDRSLADTLQDSVVAMLFRVRVLTRDLQADFDCPPELGSRLAAIEEQTGAALKVFRQALAAAGTETRANDAESEAWSSLDHPAPPARLLVVDDEPVVCRGVAALVRGEDDLVVAGEAYSVSAALRLLGRGHVDAVLLDLRLPDMSAPEAIPLIRQAAPSARIILFSPRDGQAAAEAATEVGVDGVLLKDSAGGEITDGIRRVVAGERVLDERLVSVAARSHRVWDGPPLTRREYEVLRRVAMGETNLEIARAIGLSRNTIKSYLHAALQKLGARNRVEALARASEAGLI